MSEMKDAGGRASCTGRSVVPVYDYTCAVSGVLDGTDVDPRPGREGAVGVRVGVGVVECHIYRCLSGFAGHERQRKQSKQKQSDSRAESHSIVLPMSIRTAWGSGRRSPQESGASDD